MPRNEAESLVAISRKIQREVHGDAVGARDRRSMARLRVLCLEVALREHPQLRITLTDVAQLLTLERTYCSKYFQFIVGEPFSRWIRRIRIETAQSLLANSEMSVTEVSYAVGYDDVTTFERNFRRQLGTNPTAFRRRVVKELARCAAQEK